jgi:hypothetical protein
MTKRQHKFEHLRGTKHSHLTIEDFAFRPSISKSHTGQWVTISRCECGNERRATPADVIAGRAKTCGKLGCEFFHKIRAENGKKAGFTGHEEIYGCRWAAWRLGAESRNIPFNITIEEAWAKYIEQNKCCAITGLPIAFGNSWNRKFTASLDRIDSSDHYHLENIQWVHKRINLMKSNMTGEELEFWCRAVLKQVDESELSRYEREVRSAKNWKKSKRDKG